MFLCSQADEEGGQRESTRSKVVVVVKDIDDQKPLFDASSAFVSVSESIGKRSSFIHLYLLQREGEV